MEEDFFNFDVSDNVNDLSQNTEEINNVNDISDDYSNELTDKSYLDLLLESKGINNRTIQIADENGTISNINFDDLSEQEKFDLLNDQNQSGSDVLDDDEIATLNFLRQNKMNLQDFAEWQKQVGIQQYLSNNQQTSDIDGFSDEEVIAYDLIKRFGDNMTDEEIDQEVDRLKQDEESFKKRVDLLRNSYKNEELALAKFYEDENKKIYEANQQQFINAYEQTLSDIKSIQGIELDDDDKNELYQFVLEKDPNNKTQFSKLLNDPEQVIKMAWFALHGEEAMNNVIDYFKKEITKRERGNSVPRVVNRQTRGSKDSFKF